MTQAQGRPRSVGSEGFGQRLRRMLYLWQCAMVDGWMDEDSDDPEAQASDQTRLLEETPPSDELHRYFEASLLTTLRRRNQWLVVLLLLQSASAWILEAFHHSSAMALVAYVPMVVGTSGSAGNQAVMAVTRALGRGGTVAYDDKCRILRREAALVVVTSSIMGLVAGVRVLCAEPWYAASAAVALTVWLVVLLAVIGGVAMTLLLDHLHIDPVDVAAPMLSSTIDVIGVAVLVGIAALLAL